jgi:hypothetical protein
MKNHEPEAYSLDRLQKTALSLMAVLTLLTFVGANLQAILWQSSDWLVSTVLPATVIDLTNKERSELSQTPLQRNTTLDAAAKLKAKHMAENEYFAHFSPDGVSPWYWFDSAGYTYAHAGENLAIHFTDSSEVVDAWMDSPTHRENIVNNQYTEIGVGTAKGTYEGYDTVYVVQLFGTPGMELAEVAQSTPNEPQEMSVPVAPSTPEVAAAQDPAETSIKPPVSPTPTQGVPDSYSVTAETETSAAIAQNTVDEERAVVVTTTPVSQTAEIPATEVSELLVESQPAPEKEVVIIERELIATSSGLAVANITTENPLHAGATSVVSFATKPNALLQFVYLGLGLVVFLLLTASLVMEARQLRFVQVAYSLLLLFGMGGLWFLNSVLTSGAVIV